ncbi:hypothetical protein PENTCL1PPCAC_30781, partial [Pristionchus entomophagus]
QSALHSFESVDMPSSLTLSFPNILLTTPTPRNGSFVENTISSDTPCQSRFEPLPPYSESWPASHRCDRTMEEGLEGIGSIMP